MSSVINYHTRWTLVETKSRFSLTAGLTADCRYWRFVACETSTVAHQFACGIKVHFPLRGKSSAIESRFGRSTQRLARQTAGYRPRTLLAVLKGHLRYNVNLSLCASLPVFEGILCSESLPFSLSLPSLPTVPKDRKPPST